MAEEGGKLDLGNDVKFFAEKFVEHLETLAFGADHEVFAGAIFEAINSFALTPASGDADEGRD